jgi:hypothetical protein
MSDIVFRFSIFSFDILMSGSFLAGIFSVKISLPRNH